MKTRTKKKTLATSLSEKTLLEKTPSSSSSSLLYPLSISKSIWADNLKHSTIQQILSSAIDYIYPVDVEIKIDEQTKSLWVNINGVCVIRLQRIHHLRVFLPDKYEYELGRILPGDSARLMKIVEIDNRKYNEEKEETIGEVEEIEEIEEIKLDEEDEEES